MTDDEFSKLANTFGFAPSRALRELVEVVEGTTRHKIIAAQASNALNQLLLQEQRNGNSEPGSQPVQP